MDLLRLYQTVGWLAEGADPKDRGPGDALVALAADALMAARHLEPERGVVTRRMLQASARNCDAVSRTTQSRSCFVHLAVVGRVACSSSLLRLQDLACLCDHLTEG